MNESSERRGGKTAPVFETQAISDAKKKLPGSGVSIPPEASVKEAGDWVAHNEK